MADKAGRASNSPSSVLLERYQRRTPGQPVVQDYIPLPFAQADYLINLAVPKSHAGAGITACGKNFYGALLRCPDGYFRDGNGTDQAATLNYSSLHKSLPNSTGPSGIGKLSRLGGPDGHPNLGGKTLLCLGDGLFSGQDWSASPTNGTWRRSTATGPRAFLPH